MSEIFGQKSSIELQAEIDRLKAEIDRMKSRQQSVMFDLEHRVRKYRDNSSNDNNATRRKAGRLVAVLERFCEFQEMPYEKYTAKYGEREDESALLVQLANQTINGADLDATREETRLFESLLIHLRRGMQKVKRGKRIVCEANFNLDDSKKLHLLVEELEQVRKRVSHG